MSSTPTGTASRRTPTLSSRFADALPEMGTILRTAETPARPQLVALNDELAAELGLDAEWLRTDAGIAFLLGQDPDGGTFVAQAYSGHQFGQFNPYLGDGRALLLGEITDDEGRLRDIHLKGSGRTPYSRGGDGRAALGPMLREYLVSESMAALGVPTTRSLAVIATGHPVQRETTLPGAVLVRVAASHLRVGSFQFARIVEAQAQTQSQAEAESQAQARTPSQPAEGRDVLRRLADSAIERHHPDAAHADNPYLALLDAVITAQAELVAQWMTLGFVHGVMNTDNMTISGETIDYGPCAFMDHFDPRALYSSIDHAGRYSYGNQPAVAQWDLTRFAEALLPLLSEDPDTGIAAATALLEEFPERYSAAWRRGMARKLGLAADTTPASHAELFGELMEVLTAEAPDYTTFFCRLTDLAAAAEDAGGTGNTGVDREPVLELVPFRDRLDAWLTSWLALAPDAASMRAANPVYIPRNHLVEEALSAATDGDLAPLGALLDAVTTPYERREGLDRFERPAPEDFGRYTTYCGT